MYRYSKMFVAGRIPLDQFDIVLRFHLRGGGHSYESYAERVGIDLMEVRAVAAGSISPCQAILDDMKLSRIDTEHETYFVTTEKNYGNNG